MLLKLHGKDTDDKEQAFGAYLDAYMSSLEAIRDYPAFEGQQHLDDVKDFKAEISGFTKFVEITTKRHSNLYENKRLKVEGEINGPATALKYIFNGQRNFTQNDATLLETHLRSVLTIKFNVLFHGTKPHCVVHIELR